MFIPFHRLPRLGLIVVALSSATVANVRSGGTSGVADDAAVPPPLRALSTPSTTDSSMVVPSATDPSALLAIASACPIARDHGSGVLRDWRVAMVDDAAWTASRERA